MDRQLDGAHYTTLMASDMQRDGMALELHRELGGQHSVVAEVFYSDVSNALTLSTFNGDVPLELIEDLVVEAKVRLVPRGA